MVYNKFMDKKVSDTSLEETCKNLVGLFPIIIYVNKGGLIIIMMTDLSIKPCYTGS